MSINGKFELDEINQGDLIQMAQSAEISGNLVIKEFQRIKNSILPTAESVLNERCFPESFKNTFYKHLLSELEKSSLVK